ncbi:hypothetical protein TW95_gp0598 [Pandoravirus inopinatum]|uniref:Transmembrane protein n=1 Tax=Pandoravirus inopinatum TaxID=1605721 RepID=A0A0B5JCH6_9VIRU|nr:hypothetical protein TW95_gp0598 [Pandoravirus inopinatum]AJF97332.1 hypothetical protein [Pandoravirus inopinatum]
MNERGEKKEKIWSSRWGRLFVCFFAPCLGSSSIFFVLRCFRQPASFSLFALFFPLFLSLSNRPIVCNFFFFVFVAVEAIALFVLFVLLVARVVRLALVLPLVVCTAVGGAPPAQTTKG